MIRCKCCGQLLPKERSRRIRRGLKSSRNKPGARALDKDMIREIKRLRRGGLTYRKIAARLNISAATAHKYALY